MFLDDSPVRRKVFRTKYPEADCVSTSAVCIAALRESPYDLVCLDHDLGGGDTGMAVVQWLAKAWPRPRIRHIVIHSTNLLRSVAMLARLRHDGYTADYVPFSYDPGGPFHL